MIKNQKEQVFKQKDQQKETIQLLSEVRISHKALLKTIEKLTNSPILPDSEKILQIKQLLEDYHQQTSKYHTEPKLDALLKQTMDKIDVQNYYRTVEDLSLKLQNRVADILRNIAFDTTDNQNVPDIMLAIQHYQVKVGNIGKEAPINFLTDKEQDELYTPERKFNVSLYKALLFFHTADALKAGIISLKAYRYFIYILKLIGYPIKTVYWRKLGYLHLQILMHYLWR